MRYLKFLFSPLFMGILFVVFALSMAVATFLENDYGSAAAYSMVYNTRWFELILLLLAVNLVGQLIVFKYLRKEKLNSCPVSSFLCTNDCRSRNNKIFRLGRLNTYPGRRGTESCAIQLKNISDIQLRIIRATLLPARVRNIHLPQCQQIIIERSVNINGREYELILAKIIPNASESIVDSPEGSPVISMLVTKNMMERETLILQEGRIKNSVMAFRSHLMHLEPADVNISVDSGKFYIASEFGHR